MSEYVKRGNVKVSGFSKSGLIYWNVKVMRVVAIDPGGKTGIYFKNGEQEQFLEINKEWKETYKDIKELVKEKKINAVIYENTNYIHKRTKDGLNLFRLLKVLEVLLKCLMFCEWKI